MRILVKILLATLAVLITAHLLPGVMLDSIWTAVVVAVILGIVNAVLRPLLVLLTLPVTVVTMGLFLFVVNALMVLLVDAIVPGFSVAGFWWAMLFSVVVSLIGWFLDAVTPDGK